MIEATHYKDTFEASFGPTTGTEPKSNPRALAFSSFLEKGLPHKRLEDWRYSDVKALNKSLFTAADANPKVDVPDPITNWPRLMFINGTLVEDASPLPKGITIAALSIDGQPSKSSDALSDMNLAFAQGGFSITVKSQIDAGGIEVLNIFTGTADEASHVRNTITLEAGAKLELLQHVKALGDLGLATLENHITLGAEATLTHYQDLNGMSTGFINVHDHIATHQGQYNHYSLLSNAIAARHTLSVDILEPGSDVNLNGAFLAKKGEVLDTLTRINHLVPEATSNQVFKNIVGAGGQSSFQGRVLVEKDAQKTLADQSCKNLLLDRTAEANVKPELLIFADDVKCSHGATIGELDDNALFYMMQRGIPKGEARGILVRAFLSEAFKTIENDLVLAHMEQQVDHWMSQQLGHNA
jgi:Fe-S cluster assembly protein SufD